MFITPAKLPGKPAMSMQSCRHLQRSQWEMPLFVIKLEFPFLAGSGRWPAPRFGCQWWEKSFWTGSIICYDVSLLVKIWMWYRIALEIIRNYQFTIEFLEIPRAMPCQLPLGSDAVLQAVASNVSKYDCSRHQSVPGNSISLELSSVCVKLRCSSFKVKQDFNSKASAASLAEWKENHCWKLKHFLYFSSAFPVPKYKLGPGIPPPARWCSGNYGGVAGKPAGSL